MRISDWSSDVCSSDLGAWSENDDLQGVPLCIEQMLAIGPFEVNWGGIDDSLTGNIEHCGFLSREGCTNPPRHPRCAGRTAAVDRHVAGMHVGGRRLCELGGCLGGWVSNGRAVCWERGV